MSILFQFKHYSWPPLSSNSIEAQSASLNNGSNLSLITLIASGMPLKLIGGYFRPQ